MPIEISHCILPGLHRNPEVLWVLASGVNDRVFDEKGAHAIISLAWRETYRDHFLSFILDLLVACLFWSLAFLMNKEYPWLEGVDDLAMPDHSSSGLAKKFLHGDPANVSGFMFTASCVTIFCRWIHLPMSSGYF